MQFLKFFSSKEWSLLWPFYSSIFIYTLFIFFGPYWIIYFREIGLSFFKISVLIAIYLLVPLFFEVPTGALADIYGRKNCVIFGNIAAGLVFLLVPFSNNLIFLIVLYVFAAFFSTIASGADHAWIIDLLKSKKQSKLIQNYYIKSQSIGSLAVIFMGILSVFAVKYLGLKSIWFFTSFGIILSALILFFGEEHFVKNNKSKGLVVNTFKQSKKSIRYVWENTSLLFLLVAFAFGSIASALADIAWQPFLINLGLEVYNLGFLYSGLSILLIGIPFLSKPLLKKIGKENHYLIILSFFEAVLLFLIFFINILFFGIFIMIGLNIVWELTKPVNATYFQRLVPSKIRATTSSLKSMLLAGVSSLGFLLSGFIADIFGPQKTIGISFIFIIPAIYFYYKIKVRSGKAL